MLIQTASDLNQFIELAKTHGAESRNGTVYLLNETVDYNKRFEKLIKQYVTVSQSAQVSEDIIFGKDKTINIVSIDVKDDQLYIFYANGTFTTQPYNYWFLSPIKGRASTVLEGGGFFKYFNSYDNYDEWTECKLNCYKMAKYCFSTNDLAEQHMLLSGKTLFKGMTLNQISVLSFDIEADGLVDNDGIPNSKTPEVYIISNTFRSSNGTIIKKLFSLDEYSSSEEMIGAWEQWVQHHDPHFIIGYNIFSYDLPYLTHCKGSSLKLGKQNTCLKKDVKPSKKRKDGSQSYEYYNYNCFGRNILDIFFTAMNYDVATRKYVSFRLKQIIKQEGLEKEDRTHYDAALIAKNWHIPKEREIIKAYAMDDADDSLKLYDLMIPSYFYYTQYMPMTLQKINNTATGRQLNMFLCRGYLQENKAIPKASEAIPFEGAISFGIPGLYRNVWKIDVASLYPSIMRKYKVYDKIKDPDGVFLKLVEYFTIQRLENKKKYKETGKEIYKDLSESQKICINSAYGMMGAEGLNFNSPKNAALVTTKGREILCLAIEWASGKTFEQIKPKTEDDEVIDEQS